MILQYPGQRTFAIPGENWGVEFQRRWDAGVVASWYLAGGIPAANCMVAYQPKGAASLVASYINLPHPGTNDAALGVVPTWAAATGWTFNGSGQYLKTGVVPVAGGSGIIQFTGAGVGGRLFGAINPSNNTEINIWPNYGGTTIYYSNGGYTSKTPALTSGNLAVAAQKAYRNGVDEGVTIPTGSGWATVPEMYIGCWNSGGPQHYVAVNVVAFAYYNIDIAPYIAALAAAMAAL